MSRSAEAVFVSGTVQLEDGTPPPQPVVIKRVCSTMTRAEAWTDRKGHFSFKVGGGQSMIADASLDASGNGRSGLTAYQIQSGSVPTSDLVSASSLVGCDLQTELAGFRSDVVHLDRINALEKGDVGRIILHRTGNGEGLTVSATTIAAPKDAVKAYEQGLREAAKQQFDKARASFEKAVQRYPAYAVAWVGLGLSCERQSDVDAAMRAYAQASQADPKLLTPVQRMAVISDQRERWQDSEKYSAEWIRQEPVNSPIAYQLNAVANVRLDKLATAEASAREGLRLDKDGHFPRIRFVLGYILAAQGHLVEAVTFFHDYLAMDPNGSDAPALRGQLPALEEAAALARGR